MAAFAKAVAFAADASRLATLRSSLRATVLASPLCDAARYARNLEAAFEAIWRDGLNVMRLGSGSVRDHGMTA